MNIFAAFLLVDFVNYRIRPVMIAHHVVCLIGHFGALSAPAAFVDYFAAAVACELGSAVCNLNALYPRSGAALAAYVAGMTLERPALAALLSWRARSAAPASGCASRCRPSRSRSLPSASAPAFESGGASARRIDLGLIVRGFWTRGVRACLYVCWPN